MKRTIQNTIVHSINFPEGEFTHTELARFNGCSNQTVWDRYYRARKNGQIISAGKRKTEKSKGSPSLLWRVNPNFTMALMVVKPQPIPAGLAWTVPDLIAAGQVVVEPASVDPVAVEQADLQAELQSALASV